MKYVLLISMVFSIFQSSAQLVDWQNDHLHLHEPSGPCLTDLARENMKEQIAANRAELVRRGVLPERATGGTVHLVIHW